MEVSSLAGGRRRWRRCYVKLAVALPVVVDVWSFWGGGGETSGFLRHIHTRRCRVGGGNGDDVGEGERNRKALGFVDVVLFPRNPSPPSSVLCSSRLNLLSSQPLGDLLILLQVLATRTLASSAAELGLLPLLLLFVVVGKRTTTTTLVVVTAAVVAMVVRY